MRWIKEMDNYNFLGIYDVMLDIKTEINISPDDIVIPLLQNMIKFPQLFPADSIGTRDKYCETRWKAVEFLKRNGIVKDFKLLKSSHRWDSRLEIKLGKEEFDAVLKKMNLEYEKRTERSDKLKRIATNSFWDLLHPKIVKISRSRFESKHFADSVEAALKEVNCEVKDIVKQKTSNEYDGADLMNRALSLKNPAIILDDLSTETGRDIQKGYLQIFSGAMTGIRNPKAHANIIIDELRAIHFLFLASLMMFKLDERKTT